MAFAGARLSEVLALKANRIDAADEVVIFETLKHAKSRVPRCARASLVDSASHNVRRRQRGTSMVLGTYHGLEGREGCNEEGRDCRRFMQAKGVAPCFRRRSGAKGIPLNIVQRWLGHARIETTAIYASAIGDEERNLARKARRSLELAIPDKSATADGSMRD